MTASFKWVCVWPHCHPALPTAGSCLLSSAQRGDSCMFPGEGVHERERCVMGPSAYASCLSLGSEGTFHLGRDSRPFLFCFHNQHLLFGLESASPKILLE